MPHINPELLKKRKGGKLIPIVEPKAKVAKSPKKKGRVSTGKAIKENKASPNKKKKGGKSADSNEASSGVTILSEKTLFLGQKVK